MKISSLLLSIALSAPLAAGADVKSPIVQYGSSDAPVKILVFMSPGCADSISAFKRTIMPALENDYISTNIVSLGVMPVPLDDEDVELATILMCSPAGSQKTFDWQLRNGFAKGKNWTLSNAPSEFMLQPAAQCKDAGGWAAWLLETRDVAKRVFGASGTPLFVVGGKGYFNPTYATLRDLIEKERASPTPASVAFSPEEASPGPPRKFLKRNVLEERLVGKTIPWKYENGAIADNDFKAGGEFFARFRGAGGGTTSGSWELKDNGSVCINRRQAEKEVCYFFFEESGVVKGAIGRRGRVRFDLL